MPNTPAAPKLPKIVLTSALTAAPTLLLLSNRKEEALPSVLSGILPLPLDTTSNVLASVFVLLKFSNLPARPVLLFKPTWPNTPTPVLAVLVAMKPRTPYPPPSLRPTTDPAISLVVRPTIASPPPLLSPTTPALVCEAVMPCTPKPAFVDALTPAPLPVVETFTIVPLPTELAEMTVLLLALLKMLKFAAMPLLLVAFRPVPELLLAYTPYPFADALP